LLPSPKPTASLINTSFAAHIDVKAVQVPDEADFIALPSSKHFLHFNSALVFESNP